MPETTANPPNPTTDSLTIMRPANLSDSQWRGLKAGAAAHLDQVMAEQIAALPASGNAPRVVPDKCQVHDWCVVSLSHPDHDRYHCGTVVDLDYDAQSDTGWYCMANADSGARGGQRRPHVTFIGKFNTKDGPRELMCRIPTRSIAMLRWALADSDARVALTNVMEQVKASERSHGEY